LAGIEPTQPDPKEQGIPALTNLATVGGGGLLDRNGPERSTDFFSLEKQVQHFAYLVQLEHTLQLLGLPVQFARCVWLEATLPETHPPHALPALKISPTPSQTALTAAPSAHLASKHHFQVTAHRAHLAHFQTPMMYPVVHAPLESTQKWLTAQLSAAHVVQALIRLNWSRALLWISVEATVPNVLLGPTLSAGLRRAPSALLEKNQLMGLVYAVPVHLPDWATARTVIQASSQNLLVS
jgi:hypothetical protein